VTTLSYAVRGRRRPRSWVRPLPWLLAATTVGLQIAYPLVDRAARDRVTVATVVTFAGACVAHAVVTRGPAWALGLFVVTAGGGFVAEVVGVRTGVPFGDYSYRGTLGPEVASVPLVVPLAWTMMSYPVLLAARRLTRRWVPIVGGYGLMAWDVCLDPQMVDDGHWRWADPTPSFPGVDGIPLSNFAGWFLVGTLMMLVLSAVLPRGHTRPPGDEAVPAALLTWTWVGYMVGNVFWFGTDSVALVGGIALGLLVVPYLWTLWQGRA
jgi:putative membrane protein